jgi:predicted NBD/HSP70 family sugar kinase
LKRGRAYNVRVVLEAIRLYAPISRSEIARQIALSPQAISKIVGTLLDDGYLVEVGKRQDGPGPPSIELDVNARRAFAVGVDVGRDHLTAVLANLKGEVAASAHTEIELPSPDTTLAWVDQAVDEVVASTGIARDRLCGVGVGVPGPSGTIDGPDGPTPVVNPEAFPGWTNEPLAERLGERLGLPAFLENNATAAAIGERWYGEGQHVRHFFYVFFGVGLGGGLVVDGRPYAGHSGNAGELGYALLPSSSPASRNEASGPDAAEAASTYHLPAIYERLRRDGRSVRRPDELAPLFAESDPTLQAWLKEVVAAVTPRVAAVEALLDPEVIFFGGRLPEPITRHIVSELAAPLARARTSQKDHEPVLQVGRVGLHTAALGVATLPLYSAFAPTSMAGTAGRVPS